MPQLVKGGKYIFGWSVIHEDCSLRIPDEAFVEYGYQNQRKLIILPGSKSSGGFTVSSTQKLSGERFKSILNALGYNMINNSFKVPDKTLIQLNQKYYCWIRLYPDQCIKLSGLLLKHFGLHPGDRLLVGRGSHVGPAFIKSGVIVEEAKRHPEIELFN
jgi:hypothetical protein